MTPENAMRLRERQRSRLLRDMGVEVWHLRGGGPTEVVERGEASQATASPEILSTVPPARDFPIRDATRSGRLQDSPPALPSDFDRRQDSGTSPEVSVQPGDSSTALDIAASSPAAQNPPAGRGGDSRVAAEVAAPPPHLERQPTSSACAPATDSPYAVLALGAPGALLVVEAFKTRGDAMLARDIVWAACGNWTAPVRQARFDWPQPGASGSSARVLAAFIEKQAEDHAAQRVLIAQSTADRLGAPAEAYFAVPDLWSLTDGEAKAALWRRLRR